MLKRRISASPKDSGNRDVSVAVIGVGYVGLPLAVRLAEKGFSVIGVDINKQIVNQLKKSRSNVESITDEQVRNVVQRLKRLKPLAVDREPSKIPPRILESLAGTDVFIVCVHTPLRPNAGWEPDPIWIQKSAELIQRVCEKEAEIGRLPRERLIVLESTTYPGTTKEIFAPILNEYVKNGSRWYLAYSPERTSPGQKSKENNSAPGADPFKIKRVVGGLDARSRDTAVALYQTVFDSVHSVANLEAAEMIKLVENTFRFVSIGFANEMARIAKGFGLNIWEIIRAVLTKQFGLEICYPGLIGGHCIPIDPHYLGWSIRNQRRVATFIDVAERAHQDLRQDALDLIQRLLNQREKSIQGASILFFGVAYKKNVSDTRESAALDLMKKLYSSGAHIFFWDPVRANHSGSRPLRVYFTEDEYRLLLPRIGKTLKKDRQGGKIDHYFMPEELKGDWGKLQSRILSNKFHCLVIATGHEEFQAAYADMLLDEQCPPVADLCNAVETWMIEKKIPAKETRRLKIKLQDCSKYRLLGPS